MNTIISRSARACLYHSSQLKFQFHCQVKQFHNRGADHPLKRPRAIRRASLDNLRKSEENSNHYGKTASYLKTGSTRTPPPFFSESTVPHQIEGANYSRPVSFPPPKKGDRLRTTSSAAWILSQPALIICRKLEVLNVLLNFDQANQYVLKNPSGQDVGYLVEENTISSSLVRNILHSRRPFHATVLDLSGTPVLKIYRPLKYFLNSKIIVSTLGKDGKEIGHVDSDWHLFRRKYGLFVGQEQLGLIDEQPLSWDFSARDVVSGQPLGLINRNFSGFITEIFTEKGQYVVHFDATPSQARPISLDERAVLLACAITIDIDYFSKSNSMIVIPADLPVGGGSRDPTEAYPPSPNAGIGIPGPNEQDDHFSGTLNEGTSKVPSSTFPGTGTFMGETGSSSTYPSSSSSMNQSMSSPPGKNQWGDDEFVPDEKVDQGWGSGEFIPDQSVGSVPSGGEGESGSLFSGIGSLISSIFSTIGDLFSSLFDLFRDD